MKFLSTIFVEPLSMIAEHIPVTNEQFSNFRISKTSPWVLVISNETDNLKIFYYDKHFQLIFMRNQIGVLCYSLSFGSLGRLPSSFWRCSLVDSQHFYYRDLYFSAVYWDTIVFFWWFLKRRSLVMIDHAKAFLMSPNYLMV